MFYAKLALLLIVFTSFCMDGRKKQGKSRVIEYRRQRAGLPRADAAQPEVILPVPMTRTWIYAYLWSSYYPSFHLPLQRSGGSLSKIVVLLLEVTASIASEFSMLSPSA